MRVLFIGQVSLVFDLFQSILLNDYGMDLDHTLSFDHASSKLDEGEDYCFIIVCFPFFDAPMNFFKKLKDEHNDLSILFTADTDNISKLKEVIDYHPKCSRVAFNTSPKIISASIKKVIKTTERKNKSQEGYCRMPISYFKSLPSVPFDVFLRINESKYVKIVHRNQSLQEADLIKYTEKKVHQLFLKSSDYQEAVIGFMQRLNLAIGHKDTKSKHLINISKFGHESFCQLVKESGLSDDVLILADRSIKAIQGTFKKDKNLKKHIQEILKGDSPISSITLLTVFLSNAIAYEAGFRSEMDNEKLTIAGFFQDMCTDDHELIVFEESSELKKHSPKRVNEFLLHPKKAVDAISKIDDIPSDVDKLILSHHENPLGTGFPRSLDWKKISPLMAINILAHSFARCLYYGGMSSEFMADLADEFTEKFDKGNYRVAIKALRAALVLPSHHIECDEKTKITA